MSFDLQGLYQEVKFESQPAKEFVSQWLTGTPVYMPTWVCSQGGHVEFKALSWAQVCSSGLPSKAQAEMAVCFSHGDSRQEVSAEACPVP